MFWELALALHICILVGLPVEVVECERAENQLKRVHKQVQDTEHSFCLC